MKCFQETASFITGTTQKKIWALILLFPPNILKLKSHKVHFSFFTKKKKEKRKNEKEKERKTESTNTSAMHCQEINKTPTTISECVRE